MCKSKNTTSNFPSSRISGASVLLVRINAFHAGLNSGLSRSSRKTNGSRYNRPRLGMPTSGFWRSPARRIQRQFGKSRFRPQNFIAVELDAHTQLAARRIDRLETQYVTGASPFCGRSAADFLRHFQKNLDRRADNRGASMAKKTPLSETFSDSARCSVPAGFPGAHT